MANPSHCLALGLAVGLCGGLSYVPFPMLGIHGSVCNFVPGLHAGRLLDLETMKKPCTCGQWIRREPLVGYQKTAAAAQYPKQLCEAYCKLQVGALLHCTPSKQSTCAYHLWLSPNMCTLLRGYALAELLLPYLDAGL